MAESSHDQECVRGCVIVVSKCPIPGKSKTRLVPALGAEGSASVAKAMLTDVLVTLSDCSLLDEVSKVLLYAPGDRDGLEHMREILASLQLHEYSPDTPHGWMLLPLISPDLKASDLGAMLADALQRTREATSSTTDGGVVFLGMDAPELPLDEIVCSLQLAAKSKQNAFMCPADDGGYGMLCVPPQAPSSIFEHVQWSCPLTAVSQIKALTDHGINVTMGGIMHDIDEHSDLLKLAKRLCRLYNNKDNDRVVDDDDVRLHALTRSSTFATDIVVEPSQCSNTWKILQELKIVKENGSTDSKTKRFVLVNDNSE